MKKLLIVLFTCLYNISVHAGQNLNISADSINDGPYIFYVNDTLKASVVANGVLKEFFVMPSNFSEINAILKLPVDYKDFLKVFTVKAKYVQCYKGVDVSSQTNIKVDKINILSIDLVKGNAELEMFYRKVKLSTEVQSI